jgi:ribonuclease P protein component
MLPVDVRMKKTRDFAAMATKGRSIFGFFSTLRVRAVPVTKNPLVKGGSEGGLAPTKIAFIISTKIFKKAVERNRAKRRFRSSVRELLPTIPKGYHLLFILKPQCLDGDYQKIKADTAHMLEKIPEIMKQPLKLSPRAQREMRKGKVKGGSRFVKPAKKIAKSR